MYTHLVMYCFIYTQPYLVSDCVVPDPTDSAIHDVTNKIGALGVLTVTCATGYSFGGGKMDYQVTCSSELFMTSLALDMNSVGTCIGSAPLRVARLCVFLLTYHSQKTC